MGTVISLTDQETATLLSILSDEETDEEDERQLEAAIREQLGVPTEPATS
jgi:hypothetical protein